MARADLRAALARTRAHHVAILGTGDAGGDSIRSELENVTLHDDVVVEKEEVLGFVFSAGAEAGL